jgi:hypothetical protein
LLRLHLFLLALLVVRQVRQVRQVRGQSRQLEGAKALPPTDDHMRSM